MSQETFKIRFDDLNPDEQLEVRKETKESYLLYISLRKNGNQHNR